ncbi:MAG: hypothetical protein KDB22_30355, partial [Planctomycetales bacterium]|nr:hypothetical protein [Planctomycetales bacterium]
LGTAFPAFLWRYEPMRETCFTVSLNLFLARYGRYIVVRRRRMERSGTLGNGTQTYRNPEGVT